MPQRGILVLVEQGDEEGSKHGRNNHQDRGPHQHNACGHPGIASAEAGGGRHLWDFLFFDF